MAIAKVGGLPFLDPLGLGRILGVVRSWLEVPSPLGIIAQLSITPVVGDVLQIFGRVPMAP